MPLTSIPRAVARRLGRGAAGPWLVRRAALAPVWMKSRTFERVMTAVVSARRTETLVSSNLGLGRHLRVVVPSGKPGLVFGRPEHYAPERATLELVLRVVGRADGFIDVGANEGLFTFAVATRRGRHHPPLEVFEPDPDLFARLRENLARNGIAARCHPMAVGAAAGRGVFHRNLSDDASGSLVTHFAAVHETKAVSVDVTTLAAVLTSASLSHACVKVDVEGAGELVWEGLRAELGRVAWLVLEVLEPEVRAGLPARIIAESGWSAYYIRDFDLVWSAQGAFEYRHPFYNWLFCPTPPDNVAALLGPPFRILRV